MCIAHYQRLRRYGDPLVGGRLRERVEGVKLRGLAEYTIWSAIIERCYNPKTTSYSHYGKLGVKVCEAWRKSFVTFYRDMGPRPNPKHSIDRINAAGNYEPKNCRWALRSVQDVNKRLLSSRNTSGYRGVSWSHGVGMWLSCIGSRGKTFAIGYFADPAEAAWHYDQWAYQLHGEYATLNFDYQ
jgi:hypothetical protein